MLFKALNAEMLSKVVIFFLQSFSKNCMASLPLFAYIYERENKNRPYYSNVPYLCFYKCPLRNRQDNQRKNTFVPYEARLC